MDLGFKAKVPGCYWSLVKQSREVAPPTNPPFRILGHSGSTVVTPVGTERLEPSPNSQPSLPLDPGHRYLRGKQLLLEHTRLPPSLGHTLDRGPGLQVGSSGPLQMPLGAQE